MYTPTVIGLRCAAHLCYPSAVALRMSQLEERLACGSGPAHAEDVEELAARGVNLVLSLQTDDDLRSRGLSWDVLWRLYVARRVGTQRVPIVDYDKRDLARHLDDAVAVLHRELAAGKSVYVHCSAGLNRSPTTVIAYLMMHRGMSRDAAIAWLLERHEAVPYPDVLTRFAKRHKLALTG